MKPRPPLPTEDMEHVLQHSRDCWEQLRGTRVLMTGGTGFFGSWLLETFLHANERLELGAVLSVLSRSPSAFLAGAPHLAGRPGLEFVEGDVRTPRFAADFRPDYILHAATSATPQLVAEKPMEVYSSICDGTRSILDLARTCSSRRLLFVSSGAVYGEQPADLPLVGENYNGAPNPLQSGSVYGEAKRMAENLCAMAAARDGLSFSVARGFAFVGPCLPLDAHFAAGNFLNDALRNRDIEIKGDGTPLRSYLYCADLAAWLLTILLRGAPGEAYNVGSENALSIGDLARMVLKVAGSSRSVHIAGTPAAGVPPKRYVPSTAKARNALGLREWISLESALQRTLAWHARQQLR